MRHRVCSIFAKATDRGKPVQGASESGDKSKGSRWSSISTGAQHSSRSPTENWRQSAESVNLTPSSSVTPVADYGPEVSCFQSLAACGRYLAGVLFGSPCFRPLRSPSRTLEVLGARLTAAPVSSRFSFPDTAYSNDPPPDWRRAKDHAEAWFMSLKVKSFVTASVVMLVRLGAAEWISCHQITAHLAQWEALLGRQIEPRGCGANLELLESKFERGLPAQTLRANDHGGSRRRRFRAPLNPTSGPASSSSSAPFLRHVPCSSERICHTCGDGERLCHASGTGDGRPLGSPDAAVALRSRTGGIAE